MNQISAQNHAWLKVRPKVQSLYTARQSRISLSSAIPCPRSHQSFALPFALHAVAVLGPREPLGVPVWKPFLNFLATVLR